MADTGEGAWLALKKSLGNQISSSLLNGCEAADHALFWAHCPEVLEIQQTLELDEHMVERAVEESLKELEGKRSLAM